MPIKIGWIASSVNRCHPADRRRFGWFLRNIDTQVVVESAQKKCFYDILYISINADLDYCPIQKKTCYYPIKIVGLFLIFAIHY